MLVLHHLQRSQSDRIIWLCEELGIPYELKLHQRDPHTLMSPPSVQALHPSKSAPVIQDGNITLAESGAIFEYILTKYGNGNLVASPTADNYADYLYFLHFGNGYFQPALVKCGPQLRLDTLPDDPASKFSRRNFERALEMLENRLAQGPWLAGDDFTAADIMNVCTLTTMRLFFPYSLKEYPNIVAFLQRVAKREAYQRALAKGDPGLEPVIGVDKPEPIRPKAA